jgi:hypothetical protein
MKFPEIIKSPAELIGIFPPKGPARVGINFGQVLPIYV